MLQSNLMDYKLKLGINKINPWELSSKDLPKYKVKQIHYLHCGEQTEVRYIPQN